MRHQLSLLPVSPSPSFYMDKRYWSSKLQFKHHLLAEAFSWTPNPSSHLRCSLLCSHSHKGPLPQPSHLQQQLSLHQPAVPSEHLKGGNCIFNLKYSPRVVWRISKINKALTSFLVWLVLLGNFPARSCLRQFPGSWGPRKDPKCSLRTKRIGCTWTQLLTRQDVQVKFFLLCAGLLLVSDEGTELQALTIYSSQTEELSDRPGVLKKRRKVYCVDLIFITVPEIHSQFISGAKGSADIEAQCFAQSKGQHPNRWCISQNMITIK